LSPGGSGYFTCIQNMQLVTNKFKSGGLHENQGERNVVYKTKARNAVFIGHIFRRKCLLELRIEGKIEGLEDRKEDMSRYWMTLRRQEDTES